MLKIVMMILVVFSLSISLSLRASNQHNFTYSIGSYYPDDPDLDEECDYDWEDRDECIEHYSIENWVKLLSHNSKLIKFTERTTTQVLNGYQFGTGRRYITAKAIVSDNNKIDKPVYFISGFDPQNNQGFDYYWNNMGLKTLGNTLVNQGYDFIFVDIDQDVNRVAGIFNDTVVFRTFLKAMNSYLGISGDVNTVIGYSAGGIVARTALKQMENVGETHFAHTYISYDAPHQGANPTVSAVSGLTSIRNELDDICGIIGIFAGRSCTENEERLRKIQRGFTSRRAQELLITGNYSYDFYQSLKNVGYPKKTRNIALSNGSNSLEKGYATGELLLKKKVDFKVKSKRYWFHAEDIANNYNSYFDYSSYTFDNAPGSTSNVLLRLATDDNAAIESSGIAYRDYVSYNTDGSGYASLYTQISTPYNTDSRKGTTFIPVVSAFDADTRDLYANVCASMTPFDAIHSLPASDKHSNLSSHTSNITQQINKSINPGLAINYPSRDTICSAPVLAECPTSKRMDYDHYSGHLIHKNASSCTYLIYGSDEDDSNQGCTNGWATVFEDFDEYYHYECQITVSR